MVSIDGYPIDLFVSEEHAFEADVTEHPVEKGADVTDNRRRKPASVTLEGVVSDSPLGAVALDPSRTGSTSPSDDAYARLRKIDEDGEPVTITTALRRYDSMDLVSLSIPKTAATGRALRFRAVFRQVVIVENKRTTVRTATPRSKGKTKRGTKPSRPLTPEEASSLAKGAFSVEADKSLALQGAQAAGKFFGL